MLVRQKTSVLDSGKAYVLLKMRNSQKCSKIKLNERTTSELPSEDLGGYINRYTVKSRGRQYRLAGGVK
jgi:hypothetical protein